MFLGTCPCAVVRFVLCALSGFAAPGGRCCLAPVRVPWLWPAACLSGVPCGPAWCAAPRLVRLLSVLRSAFPTPWCLSPPRGLAPPALLGGCAGHAEAGREPGSLCLPLAPAEAGALGSLRVVPVRGPATGLSLAGPSGVGLGLRALQWLACVDPVTDASGFPYRPSFDGGHRRCTGAVSCGRRHRPFRVGGRHARVPCVCAFACSFWPGRAGRPPGRVLVRLTFSFARFVFLLCLAPSGPGLLLLCLFAFAFFSFFFRFSVVFFLATPLSKAFSGFRPQVPSALALCFVCFSRPPAARLSVCSCCSLVIAAPPPPSLFVSRGFSLLLLGAFVIFFFLPPCAPVLSGFLRFPAPGALGLGAVRCLLCWPSASWLSVRPLLFRAFRLAVGCSRVVAAPPSPPPPCVSRFSSLPLGAVCRVLCCAVCPWVRCCVALLRVVPPGVVLSCAVLLCCARLVPLLVVLCPLALPVVLGPCALRRCVLRCSPALCALCCVCFVVARWCVLLFAALLRAVLCVPRPLRSVRCCALLCWCACVVLFVWCVLLLAPGAVVRCCVSCCFLWCAVVQCSVWWPVVVCRWRVSVSVSLSCRVVCFPVVGVACCGALLSCVVFCGAVLSRGAVLLCSAVVLPCCWGLLCPPVACRAVLCCAVGWLCCSLPGGGVCVLWCSFPRAVRSLSSLLCALRCLVVLAVVPCFPVSCAVALFCRVVLCCPALLSF